MLKYVYLDNASTTPLDERVLQKMMPYLTDIYGNANSLHGIGRLAVKGLDQARDQIAKIINAEPSGIYFTSGGTEGDNWALKGTATCRGNKNKIVISSIEHSAMLVACEELEKQGVNIVKVKPQPNGIVNPLDFEKVIDDDTFLVCLMSANNEIGTIQPIKEVCKIAKRKGALFFTDAVQYVGAFDVDVKDLGVDMLSFSAHKFNGPKGVGCLYIKNGTKIANLISGGHQERAKRGGTSNVAGAVGMAEALKLNRQTLLKDVEYVKSLRDRFISGVLSKIPFATLNGDSLNRLPSNANFTFKGVSGEALLFKLDIEGVCASLGAACSAGAIDPSVVLTEIGLSNEDAKNSVRFTFSKYNTAEEVDYVIQTLVTITEKIKNALSDV